MRLSLARELIHHCLARMLGTRGIRGTKCLRLPRAEYSIHMVTCHRNVDMAMWCLKSFSYYALKLFDPAVYALTDVILLIDSDILFFQRPSELLDPRGSSPGQRLPAVAAADQ